MGFWRFWENTVFKKAATFEVEYDNGNSGAAATIDWKNGNRQKITLTDDCTLTFIAPYGAAGGLFLRVIQDGTGGRVIIWPGTVKWPSGSSVTLSVGAGDIDIVALALAETNYYSLGSLKFE